MTNKFFDATKTSFARLSGQLTDDSTSINGEVLLDFMHYVVLTLLAEEASNSLQGRQHHPSHWDHTCGLFTDGSPGDTWTFEDAFRAKTPEAHVWLKEEG